MTIDSFVKAIVTAEQKYGYQKVNVDKDTVILTSSASLSQALEDIQIQAKLPKEIKP